MGVHIKLQSKIETFNQYCFDIAKKYPHLDYQCVNDLWVHKELFCTQDWWSGFIRQWQATWQATQKLLGYYIKKMYGKVEDLSGCDLEQEFQCVVANCLKHYKVASGFQFSTYLYRSCWLHVVTLYKKRAISLGNIVAIPATILNASWQSRRVQYLGQECAPLNPTEQAHQLGVTDGVYGDVVALLQKDVPYPPSSMNRKSYEVAASLGIRDPHLEYVDVRDWVGWLLNQASGLTSARNVQIWGKFMGVIPLKNGVSTRHVYFETVAQEYGLTRERVRQIVEKVNKKIRTRLVSLLHADDYISRNLFQETDLSEGSIVKRIF